MTMDKLEAVARKIPILKRQLDLLQVSNLDLHADNVAMC